MLRHTRNHHRLNCYWINNVKNVINIFEDNRLGALESLEEENSRIQKLLNGVPDGNTLTWSLLIKLTFIIPNFLDKIEALKSVLSLT